MATMDKLDELYDAAYKNDINIYNAHFSNTKKAACIHCEGGAKNIILDRKALESNAEERVILAEEIAHYSTGALYMIESTYNTPIARGNRIKYEAHAKRQAIKNILPPESIQSALDYGCYSDYEIAEYCNVTMDFLYKAIDYYSTLGVIFSSKTECIP